MEYVQIASYNKRFEAEVARSLLAAHRVDALIVADDAGGAYQFPTMSGFAGVRLYVNKRDVETAVSLLKNTNN